MEIKFKNRSIGLDAYLTESIQGEWRIAEYDSHLGNYCGSHRYNDPREAKAWLENAGFIAEKLPRMLPDSLDKLFR